MQSEKEVAMRKKTFLKAVSLLACLSILMLSAPGAIASERTADRFSFNRLLEKYMDTLSSLFPFLHLNTNDETGDTSSNQTYNDDSNLQIKITGTLSSVRGPRRSDR